MKIYFNFRLCEIDSTLSLQSLLIQEGYENKKIAVALNKQFLSNADYATTYLKELDRIDVVIPMQGG